MNVYLHKWIVWVYVFPVHYSLLTKIASCIIFCRHTYIYLSLCYRNPKVSYWSAKLQIPDGSNVFRSKLEVHHYHRRDVWAICWPCSIVTLEQCLVHQAGVISTENQMNAGLEMRSHAGAILCRSKKSDDTIVCCVKHVSISIVRWYKLFDST